MAKPATPVVVPTGGADEMVVMTRRDYDALLARLGDEEAEDRMLARMAPQLAADAENAPRAPDWMVRAVIAGKSPMQAAREHAGMTQMDVAAALGVAQGHYSAIESGKKNGSTALVARIADLFKIDADFFTP